MRNLEFKRAFSLSEVLVTVAVVAVVAAVAVGIIRVKTVDLEQDVSRAKLMDSVSTALATMQLDNKLAGYANTAEFVNEFKNYYNIKSELNEDEKSDFLSSGAKSGALGDKSDANAYYVFTDSNNATIALTYNTQCAVSSRFTTSGTQANRATNNIAFRNSALDCLQGFYDINGNKGPNELGKDREKLSTYDENTQECTGNLIPVSGGSCVCPITAGECKSLGKKLDKNKCECIGEVKCPLGKVYSEVTKKCECTLNANSCDSVYSTFDENTCTCKVDLATQIKCTANGGSWNPVKGTCECKPASDKDSCESQYNGYATADQKDYCKCKCKTDAAIKTQVDTNASSYAEKNSIISYTLPSDLENGCVACGTPKTTAFSLEKENGLCIPKSNRDPKDCQGAGFLQWQGYNPDNEADSYYCKCVLTQATCDKALEDALESTYGKGFTPRENYCIGESRFYAANTPYSNYDNLSCKSNIDACVANPSSEACRTTISRCKTPQFNRGKTKPPTDSKYTSSTPHYGCARLHWPSLENVKNGSLVVTSPGDDVHATKDTCYCAASNGVKPTIPASPGYIRKDFHGKSGILESNRFTKFTGLDVKVPNANAAGVAVTVKNAVIFESYNYVYDPIILNVSASDAYAAPLATDDIATTFKLDTNEVITTAWLKAQTNPEFYFLVNDKNKNGQVDDLSELYHEAGGVYITGLEMLRDEGFTYVKDESGKETSIISYPQLAQKGLKAWADMNANAKVDGAETLDDLLVLNASTIQYTEKVSKVCTREVANPNYVAPKVEEEPAQEETTQPTEEETAQDETTQSTEDETITNQPESNINSDVEEVPYASPKNETATVSTEPETIIETYDCEEDVTKERLAFTSLSGIGVFEINTGYVSVSGKDGDGRPLVLGNQVIAIQSRYTKLEPISGLSSDKFWVEIVPVNAGTNPEIKYVTTEAIENGAVAGTEVTRLAKIEGLTWTDSFKDPYGAYILPGKPIGIFLKVEEPSSGAIKYYELTTRGLTDVIFTRK